jgi:hypothetical protein
MRSRSNLTASGTSLFVLLATLTASTNVLAQDPAAAPAPAADAPAAPPAAANDEAEEPGFEEKKEEPASASASVSTSASTEDSKVVAAATTEPPPPGDEKEAPKADAGAVVAVKILPASGYPEPHVRGIPGGSLSATIPGYQWPYLPEQGVHLALSGSGWVDTSYAKLESTTSDTDPNQTRWLNQSRFVLRATPAYTADNGWFVEGNVELVANGDQILPNSRNIGGVDDLYVRAGKWNLFDITVGRFQGWELYHYGMGLDQNTFERLGAERGQVKPPVIYGVDFFWDRPNEGGGNYAAHIYPTDFVHVELLGQIGARAGSNVKGGRATGILDLGFVKVKAAAEKGKSTGQEEGDLFETAWNGFGGSVQGVFAPYVEGGFNIARGFIDSTNDKGLPDLQGSTTTTSFGGFLNGRPQLGSLVIGIGANSTLRKSLDRNLNAGPNYGLANEHKHTQMFAAVQYSFWDRLFLKLVAARAKYDFVDHIQDPPHPFTNEMVSYRFRVQYNF